MNDKRNVFFYKIEEGAVTSTPALIKNTCCNCGHADLYVDVPDNPNIYVNVSAVPQWSGSQRPPDIFWSYDAIDFEKLEIEYPSRFDFIAEINQPLPKD